MATISLLSIDFRHIDWEPRHMTHLNPGICQINLQKCSNVLSDSPGPFGIASAGKTIERKHPFVGITMRRHVTLVQQNGRRKSRWRIRSIEQLEHVPNRSDAVPLCSTQHFLEHFGPKLWRYRAGKPGVNSVGIIHVLSFAWLIAIGYLLDETNGWQ